MTRAVPRAALLAGALALAACSPDAPQSCPGQAVARFVFEGTLVASVAAGLDPDPALTQCPGALRFPATLVPFEGTLSADEGTSAALCRGGQVLFGERTGGHWEVGASTGGAVLGACGPTCVATSRVAIRGDIDPVNPTSFVGALVEQLTQHEGACGACGACAARYELTGIGGPP